MRATFPWGSEIKGHRCELAHALSRLGAYSKGIQGMKRVERADRAGMQCSGWVLKEHRRMHIPSAGGGGSAERVREKEGRKEGGKERGLNVGEGLLSMAI